MNNGTGSNYSASSNQSDIGLFRVTVQKKIPKDITRDIFLDFDLNVSMSTDASEDTTLLSCEREVPSSGGDDRILFYLACK